MRAIPWLSSDMSLSKALNPSTAPVSPARYCSLWGSAQPPKTWREERNPFSLKGIQAGEAPAWSNWSWRARGQTVAALNVTQLMRLSTQKASKQWRDKGRGWKRKKSVKQMYGQMDCSQERVKNGERLAYSRFMKNVPAADPFVSMNKSIIHQLFCWLICEINWGGNRRTGCGLNANNMQKLDRISLFVMCLLVWAH